MVVALGSSVKPCNQHVERIVCSLHDLIVRPSMVHPPSNNNRGGGEERNLAVDQAAADKEALANVMFGPGMDWASNKRMKRLLDSTIELGFPPTTTCMSLLSLSLSFSLLATLVIKEGG